MKQSAITVRRAKVEDVTALVDLVNSAYRGASSRVGWTTEADLLGGQRTDAEKILEIINDPKSAMLVMPSSDEKSISACVHLEKVDANKAYLGMLTVAPKLQAAGVGRRLLSTAELFVRESWLCREIEMTVIAQRSELIEWYVRRGYELTTERRPFPMRDPRFGLPKRKDLEFIVLKKTL